jgi:hypothetical protein
MTGRKNKCEELCKKRIELEKLLGLKPVELEKCVKICRAFAA